MDLICKPDYLSIMCKNRNRSTLRLSEKSKLCCMETSSKLDDSCGTGSVEDAVIVPMKEKLGLRVPYPATTKMTILVSKYYKNGNNYMEKQELEKKPFQF